MGKTLRILVVIAIVVLMASLIWAAGDSKKNAYVVGAFV